ncbi:MAG: glycosyltransferase family 4 protein [Bacteroidota bacterium]
MKILYLQQQLILPDHHAGNDRCWYFASYWASKGVEVHFISFVPPPLSTAENISKPFSHPGIRVHKVNVPYAHKMSFPQRVKSFLSFAWKAFQIGKTIKNIDLVLAYTAPPSVGEIGRRLANYHKVPFLLEVADVWPDVPIDMGIINNRLVASFLSWRMNLIYQDAHHILAFSEDMKDLIGKHVPRHPSMQVVHNGADPTFFSLERSHPKYPDKVYLLYAGTLGRANGLSQLFDTLTYLPEYVLAKLEVIIVGSGNEEVGLRERAASFSNISFHLSCTRAQISNWLEKADIGLSMFAPFPVLESNGATKFFDYLAAGIPVLLNYQGWQSKYLEKYHCGLSSKQGDLKTFAENLAKLVENVEMRKKMSSNARELAQTTFDRDILAEKMLSLFQSSLRNDRKLSNPGNSLVDRLQNQRRENT